MTTLIDDADGAYQADGDELMTIGLDCCPHYVPYGSDCYECGDEEAAMTMGMTPNASVAPPLAS